MDKNARNLVIAFVLVLVACMVLCMSGTEKVDAGVKQGKVTTNTPQAIDGAIQKVMAEMPPITAATATFSASATTGLKLSYDYGSASNYRTVVSWITNSGASYDLRASNITGDSVRIVRTGADNGTVTVITVPVGAWGK